MQTHVTPNSTIGTIDNHQSYNRPTIEGFFSDLHKPTAMNSWDQYNTSTPVKVRQVDAEEREGHKTHTDLKDPTSTRRDFQSHLDAIERSFNDVNAKVEQVLTLIANKRPELAINYTEILEEISFATEIFNDLDKSEMNDQTIERNATLVSAMRQELDRSPAQDKKQTAIAVNSAKISKAKSFKVDPTKKSRKHKKPSTKRDSTKPSRKPSSNSKSSQHLTKKYTETEKLSDQIKHTVDEPSKPTSKMSLTTDEQVSLIRPKSKTKGLSRYLPPNSSARHVLKLYRRIMRKCAPGPDPLNLFAARGKKIKMQYIT